MNQPPSIRLLPDWPRIRTLVAKKLDKTEEEIQAMAEARDSLDRIELVMAIEEVLDVRLP